MTGKPAGKDLLKLLPSTLELYFTNRCNLDCRYCSSRPVKAGGEKTLSFEEIMRGIRLAGEYSRRAGTGPLTVGLTGGEPLLEFGLLRRVVLAARRELGVNLHVCTNGTLLDRARAEFLLEHGVELDVSLDGAGGVHDRNRQFPGGRASVFELVAANLAKLPRACVGRLRAVSTFDSSTIAAAAASLDFIGGLGFRSAGFGMDIYELWPRQKLPALAAALGRFRARYLELYRQSLRGRPGADAPFPFENKLGAAQSRRVFSEYSLSVDGCFFPSDTVRRGSTGAIGNLASGIDFRALAAEHARLAGIIARYPYPNGIMPAADRYYHALSRGAAPAEYLRNGAAVAGVFEAELGGLMYVRSLTDELARDKAFGDFTHRPRYASAKPVPRFAAAAPADLPAVRRALDYFLCAPGSGKRLALEAPEFTAAAAKALLYALVKTEQTGGRARLSVRK